MDYSAKKYSKLLGMSIRQFAKTHRIPYETARHHCMKGYCKLDKRMPHAKSHRLYKCYRDILTRCYSPKSKTYPRYGGRGIRMCPEWFYSFEAFVRDMDPSYQKGLSIDRIDNDGQYTKENCRWASVDIQTWNRGNNRPLPGLTQVNESTWVTQLQSGGRLHTTRTVHSLEEAVRDWRDLSIRLGKPIEEYSFETWVKMVKATV